MNRARKVLLILAAAVIAAFAGGAAFAEGAGAGNQVKFNIIENPGFERIDDLPVSQRTFGKWYVGGARAAFVSETAAEGSYSLKLSDRTEGAEVGHRVKSSAVNNWAYGTEYECAGSFYSPTGGNATLMLEFTVWSEETGHAVGGQISAERALDTDWTEISFSFTLFSENGNFFVETGEERIPLGRADALSAVDVFPTVSGYSDFYLDGFRLRPMVADGDAGAETPTGDSGKESIQGKGVLADAGFEKGSFAADTTSDSAWFPAGGFVRLESQNDFVYAGERSLKISDRVFAGDGASIRMNMAQNFRDGKTYYFSGAFASVKPTVGLFAVRVYGYNAKSGSYPYATAEIASGSLTQEWRELTGTLRVAYDSASRTIRATTKSGTVCVENVDNVSALEFVICTKEGAQNVGTTLYADNVYLSLIRVPISPEEYEPEREGGSASVTEQTNHSTKIYRFESNSGVALSVTGIGILLAIVAGILLSVAVRRHRRWNEALDRKIEEDARRGRNGK